MTRASNSVLRPVMLAVALAVATAASVLAQDSKPEAKAPPPMAHAPTLAPIDRNGVIILIRSTLLALDDANKTGNYTVLRDLGSPAFQTHNDARLAEIFAPQRRENISLSGVAVLDPQLTLPPQIEANGIMRMAGFFPSVPTQLNFELAYAPVNRQWRLFGISVSFDQAAPVAPAPPEPQPAPPQAQAAPPKSATPHGQGRAARQVRAAPSVIAAKPVAPGVSTPHIQTAPADAAEANEEAKQ